MRLFKSFVGSKVVFPFQDVVGEGTLRAVERTGYLLITGCVIEGVDAGDLVIPAPPWLRRVVE
ncbi:hypothetical protein FYJ24_06885 [Actinomycetaceae bacterium WB03_NA08]|uniref:Uncharacterized protein n=1 Tax=Scrofimicrobium canadense TaxID=2652290 RepID=A0A6N7W7T5_9ACTO|nr:hypothetical protein [Scrofimicrobium canadense]MSS84492.1 hypothetical protein [Scrofimicrobium canadense]